MTTDAVFLDAGGVFFLPEARLLREALAGVGVETTDDQIRRAHYHGMRGWDQAPGTDLASFDAYNAAAAAFLGHDRAEVRDAIRDGFTAVDWTDVIDASVTALRDLETTGLALAVVSNSNGIVESLFTDNAIAQVGDGPGVTMHAIVDSHVVGIEKPDPAIFTFALDATGAAPERAIHVGDSLKADVRGAEAAGVRPVHMDPEGLCPETGHAHVRALAEVVELVGA